ncbi:sorting nexin-4-like [Neocloeon triangulifer]|uniref:sorting nexin-4-like n=1 Tax=Neocloeon triangulifer TaxID=2078957 RepID=UPI00286F7962|nr:sorting nexin-4-like [Neocloeon triangulifer]
MEQQPENPEGASADESKEEVMTGTLIEHLEILVTEAEKRANGALNIKDFYTVYLIETKLMNGSKWPMARELSSLWRRYSQFEMLREYLDNMYPFIICPCLPEKKSVYSWNSTTNSSDTFDPDFVDRRRASLETFLIRVASHPVLSRDAIFLSFLQQNEGWQDKLKEYAGYINKAESKLKSLSLPSRLKSSNSDKRFQILHKYGSDLQMNITSTLKVRAKLLEKQYCLHKLHQNYGRVFSEWSAIEKEMGDGLQRAGHYMDSYATCIDTVLEEEELIADQLKEYLYFANALQVVCKKQELMQLNLERAKSVVEARNAEKQRIQQGKSSLMLRLFGAVDSEEIREAKLEELDQKLNLDNSSVSTAQADLDKFSDEALDDHERFKKQKNQDLKETLKSFATLQAKASRKNVAIWTHMRDCFMSIP